MDAIPQQDFSSLLDELIARADAAAPAAAPSIAMDVLGVVDRGLAGFSDSHEAMSAYVRSAEWEEVETEAVELLEQIVVVEPPSIDPGEVAAELGLDGYGASARDLDRARREFAFANHPDRVDASIRDRAMVRMQIANQLIDDAKAKARGQ